MVYKKCRQFGQVEEKWPLFYSLLFKFQVGAFNMVVGFKDLS